ncbi:protein crumbs isoform X2 [Palaemon carinicauda]|uniref:protein crumbs isoform X2 n=1 Tax=Palaemon carinicauda TaxID=392227 RepID=UPI0035B5A593
MERHIVLGVCLLLIAVQLNPAASQISQPELVFTQPPSVAPSGDNFVLTDDFNQDSEPPDTSPAPPPPNDETPPVDVYTPEWDGSASISETDDSYLENLQTEDATSLTLGGSAREGYFTPNSVVLLPPPISVRSYTSISFRTCSFGTLLSHSGPGGDALSLGVSEEGSLVLKLNHRGQAVITTLGRGLNDNAWHRAYLRIELGILTLGVDQETAVVANTTSNSSSLIELVRGSSGLRLRIGANFTGCILQGAGTELTNPLIKHSGVEWGSCPLPDGTDCSGYDEDHCFSQPCGRHGVCTATQDGYVCNCYTRYSGEHCQVDSGPLCLLDEFQCENGGMCQEDRLGNSTYCACPVGLTGPRCQTVMDESFCDNDNNPCRNNATCTMNSFGDIYECQCKPGFSGINCDINDDDCVSQPCWYGGTCIDKVNSFECNCEGTGYEGDICQTNIDECLLNDPCTNGATCFDLYGDYECACAPGYTGKYCEVEILECSSNPCQNGGLCEDRKNAYKCSCVLGFEGNDCEHNIDDCFNVTCPWNAQAVDFINECVCHCKPGFAGFPPDCIEIDECLSSPCLNGGTCSDGENSYSCTCPQGYSGDSCEVNNDDCSPNPCQNGGTCLDGIDTYACMCPPGFVGEHCEENLDECASNVCVNFAQCIDQTGDYECVCLDGWTGKNCDQEIDECASLPCQNGATCHDGLNGFTCMCPAGFSGELCSFDVDDCVENPCLNGGSCIDGINNYTCDCLDSFMGTNCEEEYDACASNPCHNAATCSYEKEIQDYTCECAVGFEGQLCQDNIDDCWSVDCPLGKVCFDLVNNYECRCPAGFTGDNCTENIDECESNPCLNDGVCHDGLANYTCDCPDGYTGYNCEEDVDECELLKPCVNGICQNKNGSYQCYCQPGYSGDHCNLEFDECLSRPCRNGGECINEINGYKCICEPGFTGTDCDTDIDECASDPCQNNATCYDEIANFTCECLPGFTDLLCSTNIDECESEPCMNGGACTDGINNYTCNCDDTGFRGDQCEINIDDCESSPCQHGSTCSDLIKDYVCQCYDGYEGKNCETDFLECQTFPCENNATCLERSNTTLYEMNVFTNFSYETAGGFICECLPGFTGDYCEINIDECASDPCINGDCIDGINTYTCDCFPGYEGSNCEIEIDECARFTPCVYGTCVDKVADYDCECEDDYGGKNCSVKLTGCNNVECFNGGTCEALLRDETEHYYECHCEHGFTGRNCENSTTMSFSGKSYVSVDSRSEEGYDLSFRFRTTLPNGVLAVVKGETYAILQLLNGELNLYSPLIQELPEFSGDGRLDGMYSGSELNDGQWQAVRVTFNESHVYLAANDEATVYPVDPSQTINSSTTVLGGATSTLAILLKGAPFFTGCIEDVYVDGGVLIPSDIPSSMKISVEEGCPREEQCSPNPCMNDGECKDMWTSYLCNCQRPYLGDTCQLSFTPATFGNEDILDSLVTVIIPEIDHATYRTHADVSMLVRTRESDGLIFYLGTPLDSDTIGQDKHLLAQLIGGDLVLRVLLDGPEESFNISEILITDGDPHLLHVKRINNEVEVYVDNTQVLNSSLAFGGNLDAQVLYLGGVPDNYHSRIKRQLGVTNFTTTVTRVNFKGILQDIRLSNGTETRLVQPFPLGNVSSDLLPGLDLEPIDVHGVLEGVVSDNTCDPDPCQHDATCAVTWNDFNCTCTFGFKGKTCEDREYCALYQCPSGSECINLDDGYECVANLTLNGVDSSLSFLPRFNNTPSQITDVMINYRSQVGGVIFSARAASDLVWIGLTQNFVVVHQESGLATNTAYFTSNITLDGNWHLLKIVFNPSGLQVTLGDVSLIGTDSNVIVDFSSIITNGKVLLGSSYTMPTALSLLDPSLVMSSSAPENALVPEPPSVPQIFRGCVGEIRIQGILMPYFSQFELDNNTAANTFRLEEPNNNAIGCTVCFNHECRNDGYCADPSEIYTCSCPLGFEGDQCQVNIDECIGNMCTNGATCVDGINQYTCSCMPGYTGIHCDEDIDECAVFPCKNGGICQNEIAQFICQCPEDYIGYTCEELKIKNCSNNMCKNGATCVDGVINPYLGVADNYSCSCPFGYDGINCDGIMDFCNKKKVVCVHGECDHTFEGEGWACECTEGWQGLLCDEPTDECTPNPCLHGGTCFDSHLAYTCQCPDGWKGDNCEEDVDECQTVQCFNDGECINTAGSYFCECTDRFCGQSCSLPNPCLSHNCSNDGICEALCDETITVHGNKTKANCKCSEGWTGEYCLDQDFLSDVELAIIIGCVVGLMLISAIVGLTVFFMMAKKKRQTRGTYSPSRQEFYSPRVEMGNIMKPPPEERLI